MIKCKMCGREVAKPRRELCISCYRRHTGFSGGRNDLWKLEREIENVKIRLSILEVRLEAIKKEREIYEKQKSKP